jgi:predicted nucleic-acid-binding protein
VIGLDTNVIVRFLAQDDDIQSPIATRLMSRLSRERPGFVSAVVLAEVTGVLSRSYKASRADIAAAVEGLLRAAEIVVENAPAAYRALGAYQAATSAEFADALIAETAALAGASETVTFDERASAELAMRQLR